VTLQEALKEATCRLRAAGLAEPRLEAEVLLAWASNYTRSRLLARLGEELSLQAAAKFWPAVEKRSGRYPLQYLTGRQEFMSLEFKVSPSVLIPRQETEVVVEAVLQHLEIGGSYTIADLGTGSGAIVLSLARYLPRARLYATDISPSALEVARQNATALGLEKRVIFYRGNYLTPLKGLKFDVIVSNPPYIPGSELGRLPQEVRYEPRKALDGGPDGIAAYRELLPRVPQYLKPGGFVALEIGHNQGEAVKRLARVTGTYRCMKVLPDYGGRDRCFIAYVK